ncbi:hypothetical protein VT03_26165 [Planctomyces sp. SH-PL14]|nr:hypothetical protein VT03_26165 [Planctomyces sp. SH-PL14]
MQPVGALVPAGFFVGVPNFFPLLLPLCLSVPSVFQSLDFETPRNTERIAAVGNWTAAPVLSRGLLNSN